MLSGRQKRCPIDDGKLKSVGQFFMLGGGEIDVKPPKRIRVCQKCGRPFEVEEYGAPLAAAV
jgi:hypothetical protein